MARPPAAGTPVAALVEAVPAPAAAGPDEEGGIEHNQVMPPDARVAADRLSDLELNAVGGADGSVDEGVLEGLDTGRMDELTASAEEAPPPEDFDRGRLGDEHVALELDVEAEVVLDDDEEDGAEVAAAAAAANRIPCPACGTPGQVLGTVCDGCGRRLPQPQRQAVVLMVDELQDTVWVRCKACGVPSRAGKPCGDCGVISPYPSND
ncbi:MAG: hypothetical protein FJ086_09545 [Deltaproteobacteria bacterium]|nr:hypothetical protein [Deltaproteobacteria bacterium]